MNLDWNWFFAAFAQCGAALIGIIAAFIISKLIGENEKEEKLNNQLEVLFINYNDLQKRINSRYFSWYDKMNIKYSSDLSKSIKDGDFDTLSDDEKLEKLFEIEPRLFGTSICLEKLNERIIELAPTTRDIGNGFSVVNESFDLQIPPKGLWGNLSDEKETINNLKIESETLIEKFQLIAKANSAIERIRPIKIVIYILIIGFILTVAYPLHFMPLKINEEPSISFDLNNMLTFILSLKGILIILLTIVVEGILIYFLALINSLEVKYNKLVNRIESKHIELNGYSEYF